SENTNIRNFQGIEYDLSDSKFRGLSKQKIKRLLKDELWESNKESIKKAFREKEKARKKEMKLVTLVPTKKKLAAHSQVTQVNLVVDCSFGHLMDKKELVSLVKQLSISYGQNKTATKSAHFHITSFSDTIRETMDEKYPSWKNWKRICTTEQSYLDKFEKKNLIYLTADSENNLEQLEDGKAYIIGGIVDKNRHKNICQQKAMEEGIKTAKLPIKRYLSLATRSVLTVNQVCEILLKWLEFKNWEKSILPVLPERKIKN
ncbi:guanine-1-methyltransferase-domain-containing protein, partial [Sporodiniella umbellata]